MVTPKFTSDVKDLVILDETFENIYHTGGTGVCASLARKGVLCKHSVILNTKCPKIVYEFRNCSLYYMGDKRHSCKTSLRHTYNHVVYRWSEYALKCNVIFSITASNARSVSSRVALWLQRPFSEHAATRTWRCTVILVL